MAKLICENGDYFELCSFEKHDGSYENYEPDCSFFVAVKSGSFSGAVRIDSYVELLETWHGQLVGICQNYEGSTSLESEESQSEVKFAYSERGYIQISGILAEDFAEEQQLKFSLSAPVGCFDTCLKEIQAEIARLKQRRKTYRRYS